MYDIIKNQTREFVVRSFKVVEQPATNRTPLHYTPAVVMINQHILN